MTTKEKYQACLDRAYLFAPFHVTMIHDMHHVTPTFAPSYCLVCGNQRLRYLCECKDKYGSTWFIGRNCHTKLEERYEEEKRK